MMMLKSLVNPFPYVFFSALNHVLEEEPWAREQLQRHANKVASFDLSVFTLTLKINAQGLLEAASDDAVPHVTIRINPAELPRIIQDPQHAISYVKIEGDADLAQTISELAKNVRWDAEEHVSQVVGDIAGRRLVRTGKAVVTSLQTKVQACQENLADYFLEENPMLVRPVRSDKFAEDVGRLRDDVERLMKRIEQCEKAL